MQKSSYWQSSIAVAVAVAVAVAAESAAAAEAAVLARVMVTATLAPAEERVEPLGEALRSAPLELAVAVVLALGGPSREPVVQPVALEEGEAISEDWCL